MKLLLTINGVEDQIDILSPAPDCRFQLGGEGERSAQVETPEPGVYAVILDGRCYDARVEETPTRLVVVLDGFRFEIDVRDPRRWTRNDSARGGEGVQTVVAPMPGKVVRILVAPGDTVRAGQGLLVVEAMKMQNEIKAARAGSIVTLTTREGATVSAGEVLLTIE